MNCPEAARLLGPYLDGELDLTASMQLEDHLAACPACREKLEAQQALVTAVREELPRHQPSPFLATRIRAALRAEEKSETAAPALEPTPAAASAWRWLFAGAAGLFAGAAGLLALIALALFFSAPSRSTLVAQEAIADHVRSLQVNHLMDVASTDQHTVKPWFAGRVDYSPPVADLAPAGYPLVGGRLDVLDQRNVAALVYQRRKHYINLFIWPAASSPLGRHAMETDGYHVFIWTSAGMNYLAVSELGTAELSDFVRLIQTQSPPPME